MDKSVTNCHSYFQASGNEDPDLVLLDTEMEKVFGGKGPNQEKFDVSSLSDLGGQSSSSNRNYLLKKSLRPAHNGGSRSGRKYIRQILG